MKLGAENRRTLIIALLLMAVAGYLFVRMVRGWEATPEVKAAITPPPQQEPTALSRVTPKTRGRNNKTVAALPTLDPRLRLNLLAQSESVKYEGRGRNIFDRESIPEPVASAVKPKPGPVTPPPPPLYTPPPIPLKFFGFASAPGEPRKVFLLSGDDVFTAVEGQVINRRFKVVRINNNSVEIEDTLTNSRQTIPLTQG